MLIFVYNFTEIVIEDIRGFGLAVGRRGRVYPIAHSGPSLTWL